MYWAKLGIRKNFWLDYVKFRDKWPLRLAAGGERRSLCTGSVWVLQSVGKHTGSSGPETPQKKPFSCACSDCTETLIKRRTQHVKRIFLKVFFVEKGFSRDYGTKQDSDLEKFLRFGLCNFKSLATSLRFRARSSKTAFHRLGNMEAGFFSMRSLGVLGRGFIYANFVQTGARGEAVVQKSFP